MLILLIFPPRLSPWRIGDDIGGAFSMGLVGSALFSSVRGYRNAPAGFSNRLVSALREVSVRAPRTGMSFAAWGGAFSTIDCMFASLRKKVVLSIVLWLADIITLIG